MISSDLKQLLDYFTWIDLIAAGVWIVLTVIMIWILYRIHRVMGSKNPYSYLGIFLLVIVWLYPIYTYLFNQLEIGAAGNVFTLLVTLRYGSKLKELKQGLHRYMIPQIIWLIVATLYIGLQILVKYQS